MRLQDLRGRLTATLAHVRGPRYGWPAVSMRTRLEIALAARHGVDLPWLARVAPDVATAWRREHMTEVDNLVTRDARMWLAGR